MDPEELESVILQASSRSTDEASSRTAERSSSSSRSVDWARKVVGVGSVGTRAFIALMEGRDDDDPLFLQIKEATSSVLEGPSAPEPVTASPASASCRGSG